MIAVFIIVGMIFAPAVYMMYLSIRDSIRKRK